MTDNKIEYAEDKQEVYELPIDYPTCVLMCGKSRSGKTHLLKWIMYSEFIMNRRFKFGQVYCKTLFNGGYDFIKRPEAKHEVFNMDEINAYIQKLRDQFESTKQPLPHNFIIFDDMMGNISQYKNEFTNFIATCRHTNTTVFILIQQLGKGASTVIKEQATAVFLFKSGTQNTLKSFYDYFGSIIPSFEGFKDKFRKATHEKYSAMLYLGGSEHDNEESNFYTVQAPEKCPDFILDF